jgi:Ca2+-binding EF-hand superfamily protein
MDRGEFGFTVNHALNFIQLKAPEDLLDSLFKVVDLDHDGWISYQVYFLFLKFYFGGASIAALETIHTKPKDVDPNVVQKNPVLS